MPLEPRLFERSFECLLASTGRVRVFIGDALDRWVVVGETGADILLIADELAANAVLHARSGFVVRLHRREEAVRLEVDDESEHPPELRVLSATSTNGRGLVLVDALAQSWGWDDRAGGKSVWAEFRVPA